MNACNETYDQNKTKCLIKKKQYFFFFKLKILLI